MHESERKKSWQTESQTLYIEGKSKSHRNN